MVATEKDVVAIGIEGSANKLGIGVIKYCENGDTVILSNPRKTYITPPGSGFMPRETAWHHQKYIAAILRRALIDANVEKKDIHVICYTKGPGMGGPLTSCAIAARTLSLLWNIPMVAVNHCIGRKIIVFCSLCKVFM